MSVPKGIRSILNGLMRRIAKNSETDLQCYEFGLISSKIESLSGKRQIEIRVKIKEDI